MIWVPKILSVFTSNRMIYFYSDFAIFWSFLGNSKKRSFFKSNRMICSKYITLQIDDFSLWLQYWIGWQNHSWKKTERNLRHRGKVARSQTESRSSWQRSTDQVRQSSSSLKKKNPQFFPRKKFNNFSRDIKVAKLQHFHEFLFSIFFDNFSREIKVVNS